LVTAVGIFMVRKWGWYLFIGFSLFSVGMTAFNHFSDPTVNLPYTLSFEIAVLLSIAFFFTKHVRSPYFNPRMRWWETSKRFRVTLDSSVISEHKNASGKVLDISEDGCFLAAPIKLDEGENIWIKIKSLGIVVNCIGRVVRLSEPGEPKGFGVMFTSLGSESKKSLNQLMSKLRKIGHQERNAPKAHPSAKSKKHKKGTVRKLAAKKSTRKRKTGSKRKKIKRS